MVREKKDDLVEQADQAMKPADASGERDANAGQAVGRPNAEPASTF